MKKEAGLNMFTGAANNSGRLPQKTRQMFNSGESVEGTDCDLVSREGVLRERSHFIQQSIKC